MSVFIVLSMIKCKDTPLSYTPVRSVFTQEQRFQQTMDTIKSIKKYAPTADILLVDSSTELTKEYYDTLLKNVTYFIHDTTCNVHTIHKAMGEASQMITALTFLEDYNYQNYFKISGRYTLTNSFDYNRYTSTDYSIVRPINITNIPDGITTSLYKLNNTETKRFKSFLVQWSNYNIGYEQMFYYFLKGTDCIVLDTIGISGFVSVDGKAIQY